MAIGDLPCLPGTAALAAVGAARSGAAYVKLGLWGGAGTEDFAAVLRAAQAAVDGEAAVIAVAYADAARVPSGPLAPSQLVTVAREAGVSGCLIDTAIKDGRGLLSWLGADALAELVAEAHGAGLEIALAGELRAEDLPTVRDTGADIAGVRSAACRDGRRTAPIDPQRIAELRAVCAVEALAGARRSATAVIGGGVARRRRSRRYGRRCDRGHNRVRNAGDRRCHMRRSATRTATPRATDPARPSKALRGDERPGRAALVEQLGEPRRLAAGDHPRLDAGGPQRGGQMLVDPRGPQRGELVDGEPRDRLAGRRPVR